MQRSSHILSHESNYKSHRIYRPTSNTKSSHRSSKRSRHRFSRWSRNRSSAKYRHRSSHILGHGSIHKSHHRYRPTSSTRPSHRLSYRSNTEVFRPSRANFRFVDILLFSSKNYLYRLHVTYKWTLISICPLPATCRHAAGQAKIPPLVWNHTSPIEKCRNIFIQYGELFFGYSYRENKTYSEKNMARAYS